MKARVTQVTTRTCEIDVTPQEAALIIMGNAGAHNNDAEAIAAINTATDAVKARARNAVRQDVGTTRSTSMSVDLLPVGSGALVRDDSSTVV
jgi:hypothetical protein